MPQLHYRQPIARRPRQSAPTAKIPGRTLACRCPCQGCFEFANQKLVKEKADREHYLEAFGRAGLD